jgi:hypothetical protein
MKNWLEEKHALARIWAHHQTMASKVGCQCIILRVGVKLVVDDDPKFLHEGV